MGQEAAAVIDLSKKRNKGSTPKVSHLNFLVALDKARANGLTYSRVAQSFDITERTKDAPDLPELGIF